MGFCCEKKISWLSTMLWCLLGLYIELGVIGRQPFDELKKTCIWMLKLTLGAIKKERKKVGEQNPKTPKD